MTTPDEQITGYGGMPRSDSPSAASSTSGQATEDMKAKAKQTAEELKGQGKAQLDSYRDTAADEIEKVAKGAEAAAKELESQDESGLSHYVSDMAQSMVQLADNLRGKSVDELFGEVNRLARDNPTLFITGSIALGFGLTRFARASSRRSGQHAQQDDRRHWSDPGDTHSRRQDDSEHLSSGSSLGNSATRTPPPSTGGASMGAGLGTSTIPGTAPGAGTGRNDGGLQP